MTKVHIHDTAAVHAVVRAHLPEGLKWDDAGLTGALKTVGQLINAGAIGIDKVAGCEVCEHPMGVAAQVREIQCRWAAGQIRRDEAQRLTAELHK